MAILLAAVVVIPAAAQAPSAFEVHEATIAQTIRRSSATAMPNIMLVGHADRILDRRGRMIAAVEALGPGQPAYEGTPFRLDIE